MLAADRRVELTGPACERLAVDPSARVRAETARLSGLSAHLLTALAADPEWTVRVAACRRAWPHLSKETRHKLLGDPSGKVRAEALLRHHQDHPMPRSVFLAADFASDTAYGVPGPCRDDLPSGARTRGTPGPPRRARRAPFLAGSPGLDPDLVALLGRDQDESVRFAVSTRPDLTEEQRAGIDIDFDPRLHHYPLDWVTDLHDDPAALRRLAASAHPSYAAASPAPSVFRRTSWNSSPGTRTASCSSSSPSPATTRPPTCCCGCGSGGPGASAPRPPARPPELPRHDLLRHADDPNPRMRQLALDDPESTSELVERFSRDPDDEVRYRAAKDPRLTVASAVRLLDDPHGHIRQAAFWHARFPARVVVRLLRDPDTAEPAARHPSCPSPSCSGCSNCSNCPHSSADRARQSQAQGRRQGHARQLDQEGGDEGVPHAVARGEDRKRVPRVATPTARADCWVVAMTPLPTPARADGTSERMIRIRTGSWSAWPAPATAAPGSSCHAQVGPGPPGGQRDEAHAHRLDQPARGDDPGAVAGDQPGPQRETTKKTAAIGASARPAGTGPRPAPRCSATAITNMKPLKPIENGTIMIRPRRSEVSANRLGGTRGVRPWRSSRRSTK